MRPLDAANTQIIQTADFVVFDRYRQQRNTKVITLAGIHGIKHGAVVKPVHTRLHNHAFFNADHVMQGKQRFLGRIARLKFALR